MKSGAQERRADNRARCPRSRLFSLRRFSSRKLQRVRTFESMHGREGVVQTIAHGVHVCGFPRCDAFRPDGGVEARVLSAGSAHVAAGLFESADPAGVRVGPYERPVSKLVVLDRV